MSLPQETVAAGAEPHANAFGAVKVKYFGRELPPRCELHGCHLTDDGVHYYCTNFACNKHRHRRTKHTRYSRHAHLDTSRPHGSAPAAAPAPKAPVPRRGLWPLLHFSCPECGARNVDMRLAENRYVCGGCGYAWK